VAEWESVVEELMDSDVVRLGVTDRVLDELLDSDPDWLGVTDRVLDELLDSDSVRLCEELGVGLIDPLTDPVRVLEIVGLGLGL